MTRHTVTVAGQRIRFELHSYPVGDRLLVEAPGVCPFDVTSVAEARDALRAVFIEQEPPAASWEYAEVLPDDCRCAWSNFSDYGGWHRTTTRRECPMHGAAAADRTPVEIGGRS